jgi:hypothetical protein
MKRKNREVVKLNKLKANKTKCKNRNLFYFFFLLRCDPVMLSLLFFLFYFQNYLAGEYISCAHI